MGMRAPASSGGRANEARSRGVEKSRRVGLSTARRLACRLVSVRVLEAATASQVGSAASSRTAASTPSQGAVSGWDARMRSIWRRTPGESVTGRSRRSEAGSWGREIGLGVGRASCVIPSRGEESRPRCTATWITTRSLVPRDDTVGRCRRGHHRLIMPVIRRTRSDAWVDGPPPTARVQDGQMAAHK